MAAPAGSIEWGRGTKRVPVGVQARLFDLDSSAPCGLECALVRVGANDDTQEASIGSGPTLAAGSEVMASGDAELSQGSIIGRYVILSHIGAGGMGVVHAAYDPELDRKVAVKILRDSGYASLESQGRLLREAQALAKLQHPNVVAVHDVGTWQGRVWLAMEFVNGKTLSEWLRAHARRWREILTVMMEVAQGLQAAHQLGLVHRDVKPDNIMVSEDGRVRVMDFGLVRAKALEAVTESPMSPTSSRTAPGKEVLVENLTLEGALIGTPAYMAPEQLEGGPTDPRTDQFSWCMTTWEALFGERPFGGATFSELSASIARGVPRRAFLGEAAPRWLRRALERGLRNDPGERFGSMQELIAALDRGLRGAARAIAVAVATSLVCAISVGFALLAREREAVCHGAGMRVEVIWNGECRSRIEQAFKATGLGYAEETAAAVTSRFDQYARAWIEGAEDACEMHRRGEQSGHIFDLRTLCLERRFSEFSALVRLMATPDGAMLDHAVQAAHGLKSPGECMDVTRLIESERWLQLPDDPVAVAAVQGLAHELTEVSTLEQAGKIVEGMRRSRELVARAYALGHQPTLAAVLHVHGRLLIQAGRGDESLDALWSSIVAAEQAGNEDVRAESLVHYMYVLAERRPDAFEFDKVAEIAQALVARIAPESRLQGQIFNNMGLMHAVHGRFDEAEVLFRRGLGVIERAVGPEHPDVAFLRGNLGNGLLKQGRLAEAHELLLDAHSQVQAQLGEGHYAAAALKVMLADSLLKQGRYDEALGYVERGALGLISVAGDENPDLGWALTVRGEIRLQRGEIDMAVIDLERAVQVIDTHNLVVLKVRVRFALAQALWRAGKDRDLALREARIAVVEAERSHDNSLAVIKGWIGERTQTGAARGEDRRGSSPSP